MTLIVDRGGKGTALTAAENDTNLDSLSGINIPDATTSLTVTEAHQNDTIEFTNAGAVAVTLKILSGGSGILDGIDTTDFKVKMINTGAGTVTITPDAADSFNTGAATIVLATDEHVTLQSSSVATIWNVIGGFLYSSQAGITAFAGGGQANATQLTGVVCEVTTCATNGDSVKLPVGIAGRTCAIHNAGAAALNIFPSSGEEIVPLGVDQPQSLGTTGGHFFVCYTAGNWFRVS